MNRLASATSPYLLQHADNPVDWWPWSPEAFAEAKQRDVPVLISVGYAACHWCHVMAHESFEDTAVADEINTKFVAIKVDREERPDVDAVYMTATQALTGQGGWPMTVFATPEGQPFFAGTYYPRDVFTRLLDAVGTAWRDQRDAVTKQSSQVVTAIAAAQQIAAEGGHLGPAVLDAAAASLAEEFDDVYGGFGGAPKFPPHLVMLFLLRHYQRTGDAHSLEMARATGEQMARGGIYDQLAGGFARYAVDGTWTVPHFEKMLYDNAMLLRAYTEIWRLTGDAMAGRVAAETAEFIIDGLGTPEGGFASALDADTAGVEGATYVWTPAELRDVLGETGAAFAADVFGVTEIGTFEHGSSVLRLALDVDDGSSELRERWRETRDTLREARERRPQPGRDDKVVAEWNGLAITALAHFATVADALAAEDVTEAETSMTASTCSTPRRPGVRPKCSTRPYGPGNCCWAPTSSTAGCAGCRATAWSVTRSACWPTTAASPPRSRSSTRQPGTFGGSPPPVACSTRRWISSPTARAASTTRRRMPRSSSRDRPIRPMAPHRRAVPRSARLS